MHIETRTGRAAVWTASVGISIAGVIAAGISLAWLVGSFGISTAAASQIVTAIEIGGAALAIVGALFGGGAGGRCHLDGRLVPQAQAALGGDRLTWPRPASSKGARPSGCRSRSQPASSAP